jgi:zinc protease
VASLTRETLTSLHQSIIAAGNLVISVFGDVSFPAVRDAVEKAFAGLPAGGPVEHAASVPVPPWQAQSLTIPSSKRQAFLVAAFPTVDLRHPDRLALDLIDEACSDMASRFFERIREQHGLAYSVGTTQVIGMAPGLFAFYLSTSPEQLAFAQKELLSEIATLAADGLTAEELDRARRTWTGKQAMQHRRGQVVRLQGFECAATRHHRTARPSGDQRSGRRHERAFSSCKCACSCWAKAGWSVLPLTVQGQSLQTKNRLGTL